MSLIRDVIGTRLLASSSTRPAVADFLSRILAPARGDVLDIGFGKGSHLDLYPREVTSLTVTVSDETAGALARDRLSEAGFRTAVMKSPLDMMPFADARFDAVVSVMGLASVSSVAGTLTEIRRVLKPEGNFIFLEPRLSDERTVAFWQNGLNLVVSSLPGGCHVNREMGRLIVDAGFTVSDRHAIKGHGMARLNRAVLVGRALPDPTWRRPDYLAAYAHGLL